MKMESSQVHELMNIFTKIVCDRSDYCFVCLRTADERRLVTPTYFQMFTAAAKISMNAPIQYVCYMCERQASNALKLYRAAVFASSLSRIVQEMAKKEIKNKKIMFETRYFRRVLNKTGLSTHLSPGAINGELNIIRRHCCLSETDTLVMDNKQVYESVPSPEVAVASRLRDLLTSEAVCEASTQYPTQTAPRSITPAILPDVEMDNGSGETYVIVDDDDDPLQPTAEPQPPPKNPNNTEQISHNQQTTSNVMLTAGLPKIVTLEDLMRDKSIMAECPNFLLHPIFSSTTGQLQVPSLSAEIVNGALVYQNASKNNTPHPLEVNIDMVKQSLQSNKEVFVKNCENFSLPVSNNFQNSNSQNSLECCPIKKKKVLGEMSENIVKGSLKNVKISDITSDLDTETPKGSRTADHKTDWEDKIPMDVISFMDAVDPNADSLLGQGISDFSSTMVLEDVRSLANITTGSTDNEVIDLC